MVLTLLRHASPAAEYRGRYNGHTDIPIDPSLFEHSKTIHFLDQHFERIYSSDLIRCTQTLDHLGLTPYTLDPRLREVRFKNTIEGKSFHEIEQIKEYSPRLLDSPQIWHDFVCDEPLDMFRQRIESFINDLPHQGSVLVCTHGGVIGMILSLLNPKHSPAPLGYLDHISLTINVSAETIHSS